MYEENLKRIEKRINAGLDLLKKQYVVRELDVGAFKSFVVADRRHVVRQFEIAGVGNLLVMTNPDDGKMQMDTFTITPYYKNLPLFTTDYMYFEDKLMFLNEIYNLVEYQDELYENFIAKFVHNCESVSSLDDMKLPACWYDDIRPVLAAKTTSFENEDLAFDLFLKNLSTFTEMEQASPYLSEPHTAAKWDKNFQYARALVEDGGVSTELFVKSLGAEQTKRFFYSVFFAPDKYRVLAETDGLASLTGFFNNRDDEGITNLQKLLQNQKIIRRVDTTDKNRSFEEVTKTEGPASGSDVEKSVSIPSGIVIEDGRIIGMGIHIFNEDVYPLQSFEIYCRGLGLTGLLDLSGLKDLVFVDVYNNAISGLKTGGNTSLRILGIQNNRIESLDVSDMTAVQGIDAGKNRLKTLDVSHNSEIVELYINDNDFTEIDLSKNQKLKYFYCHHNRITTLDTRANPLLRHLNATGNPFVEIRSLAPQRNDGAPLEVRASEGGSVGLKFNPIFNAQWKETGEWEQSYYAYPADGWRFTGWQDESGTIVSTDAVWIDEYGTSRIIRAMFEK